MALKEGETYRCPNADCGCEIEVKRGAGPEGGDLPPRCCCGMAMERA
jgi:hypothetical protein